MTFFGNISKGIIDSKQAEQALLTSEIFHEIADYYLEVVPLLKEFIVELLRFTRCSATGIRIMDGQGNIPYVAYEGLSERFYELKNHLSIKSDQCVCIDVIKGTTDPKLPFFTEGGSFIMNNTASFLSTVSESDKGQGHKVCDPMGYESVALIPIRQYDRIIGLINIADPQENMIPLDMVKVLERVAIKLGMAISSDHCLPGYSVGARRKDIRPDR